jgi:hypothetical protein
MARRTFSRRKFLAAALAVLPASATAHAFWMEPSWLVTRRLRLANFASTQRIIHFTDLHYKGDRTFLERVVSRINDLKPDLVCFTGDIIEEAEFLPEALKLLGQVRAPLYGIPGNHDYWAKIDFDSVVAAFAATGGQWLMDEEASACGGQVNVIGVTCNEPPTVKPRPGVKNVLMFHYRPGSRNSPAPSSTSCSLAIPMAVRCGCRSTARSSCRLGLVSSIWGCIRRRAGRST